MRLKTRYVTWMIQRLEQVLEQMPFSGPQDPRLWKILLPEAFEALDDDSAGYKRLKGSDQIHLLIHRLLRVPQQPIDNLTTWQRLATELLPSVYRERPQDAIPCPAAPSSQERIATLMRRFGAGMALFSDRDARDSTQCSRASQQPKRPSALQQRKYVKQRIEFSQQRAHRVLELSSEDQSHD